MEELASALQRDDTRLEASEMLRGLIEAIVLTPRDGQSGIELRGNLAAMLRAAEAPLTEGKDDDQLVQTMMVAGACNQLNLEFSWTAA